MCSICAQGDRDMPSAPEGQSGFLYLGVWIFVSHYSGNLEKHHHSWGGVNQGEFGVQAFVSDVGRELEVVLSLKVAEAVRSSIRRPCSFCLGGATGGGKKVTCTGRRCLLSELASERQFLEGHMAAAWQAHRCRGASAVLLLSLCLRISRKSIPLFSWSLRAAMPFSLLQRRSLLISFCPEEQTEEITDQSSCGLK